MWTLPIRIPNAPSRICKCPRACSSMIQVYHRQPGRPFHDYFVTHLPSTSLHPDLRSSIGPHHKLPRDKSTPHTPEDGDRTPAAPPPMVGVTRNTTVVRIPLRSAKHHFGVAVARGTRPYNEDAFQAGTIEVPAFAKRRPISLTRNTSGKINSEVTPVDSAYGDPQVFYYGVFDGHGGTECSNFLREQLHEYIENSVTLFELESSLKRDRDRRRYGWSGSMGSMDEPKTEHNGKPDVDLKEIGKPKSDTIQTYTPDGTRPTRPSPKNSDEIPFGGNSDQILSHSGSPYFNRSQYTQKAEELERSLVLSWKELVGGYFKRFKPEYFSTIAGGQGHTPEEDSIRNKQFTHTKTSGDIEEVIGIETVLMYAFLKADFEFVSAQVKKQDQEDPVLADRAINDEDVLDNPAKAGKRIGGPKRFKGGSTCSVALISTSTPAPYWHPASPACIVTAHVGDSRILLCNTATGLAVPLTSNHHPSLPTEATRLRRYAATFVTDSFGEQRISGLANTRSFGDMKSKRIGVSAEPEIRRVDMEPAEYSFMVLVSDGVSGPLSDQEIVDIVKEARTPEQGARDVVSFATEVSTDGDNATALVIRLGGWERRSEGGLGSLGTKEMRDWRKKEAEDPRGRRQ